MYELNKIEILDLSAVQDLSTIELSKYHNLKKVILPSNIKTLPPRFFANCHKLEEVNLPDTLEELSEGLFINCKKLKKLTLPKTITKIKEECFKNCKTLTNINLENITEVSSYAFKNCYKLTNFPTNATTLKKGAFNNCRSLNNVILNDNLYYLEDELFSGCTNLKNIYSSRNDIRLGKAVFKNCISLPFIPKFVKILGPFSFEGCTKIEIIDNRFKTIPIGTFRNCKNLTTVINSEYTINIETAAFFGCSNLKDFTFSNEITTLNKETFKNCYNLIKIKLPHHLENINASAFENCYSLKDLILPLSLRKISKKAFYNCHSIEKLYIPAYLTKIGIQAFSNMSSLKYIETSPYNQIYSNYNNELLIKTVNESIELYAMGLPYKNYSLENLCIKIVNSNELIIPINKIQAYAFEGAKNLEELAVPSSINSYDVTSFTNCPKLKKLSVFYLPAYSTFFPIITINDTIYFDKTPQNISFPFEELEIQGNIKTIQGSIEFKELLKNLQSIKFTNIKSLDILSPLVPETAPLTEVYIPETINTITQNCFTPNTIINFNDKFKIKQKYLEQLYTKNQEKIYEFVDKTYYLEKENMFRETSQEKIKNFYHAGTEIIKKPQEALNYKKTLENHDLATDETLRNGHLVKNFTLDQLEELLDFYNEEIKRYIEESHILEDPTDIISKKIIEKPDILIKYLKALHKYGLKDKSQLNPIIIATSPKIDIDKFTKNYSANIKRMIKKSKITSNKETAVNNLNDLYKIANMLGAFEENPIISQRACTFLIDNMFAEKINNENNPYQISGDDIHRVFDTMKQHNYNEEFSEFFINNYKKLVEKERKKSGFIADVCNNFSKISKTSTSNKGLQRHLKVTMEKCEDYLATQKFKNVTKSTLALARLLGEWYNSQFAFDLAVEIIKTSKNTPRNIFTKKDIINKEIIYDNDEENDLKEEISLNYSYEWLPKKSIENFILGKYCSCCAHLLGAGKGIMHASIADPNCQNLVIRNSFGEIIGKATIYINKDLNNAIFNNLESSTNYRSEEDLEKICNAFLRGAEAFFETYNKNNPTDQLEEIAIGTGMNTIIKNLDNKGYKTLEKELIRPYDYSKRWGGYSGNAFHSQKLIVSKIR